MLSCTEEGICVGVGGFMFRHILPSISLYVWFLEGFDLYILYIYVYIYKLYIYIYKLYIYININYIYIKHIYYVINKYVWCLMRDTLLRDTSCIIGPD